MAMKREKVYGIITLGVLSLLVLSAFISINNSQDNTSNLVKQNNNEAIVIERSGELIAFSHNDLSKESNVIVMGTVKEILPSKWNTPDGTKPEKAIEDLDLDDVIYTDIIISVDKYLKNPLDSQEVIVRILGGSVGEDTMLADDEPSFKVGEKTLLYLVADNDPATKNSGPQHFTVKGHSQGKYILTADGQAVRNDEIIKLQELLSTIDNASISE
ncbi:MAG: hypothetical protein AB9861_12010 [Methanosarcina sp.]|jgi:hypothetical protein